MSSRRNRKGRTGPLASADRLRAGEPTLAGGAVVEASSVRVPVALFPLLGGAVQAPAISIRRGTWTRAKRVVLRDLRVDARLDASGERQAHARGRVEGIVDALAGDPRAHVEFSARLEWDRLSIEARILQEFGFLPRRDVRASVEGRVAFQAEIVLSVGPKP